ncbi:hypothetical protein FM037_04660 [Shewanella psychropiezotolerans]|uniref:Uncharacterized protein n=1 Tax=Shewanella psychropiezotolerans TaxID=2593655 RepID=A0ABX5WUG9_9GAMM|nr:MULTISPECIES: hypothetical protein [Shewanella]MPY22989.1 hypothetical protein [Shewanella sp. YLB-07]QDO82654.1 hypothetical protein FM037_04660 [Shewanella psychropiezotolerans]
MKNKLILSIAMTSLVGLNISLVQAAVSQPQLQSQSQSSLPQTKPEKATGNNGACAAGKCGGTKQFGKKDLVNDPQGQLVYARDGQCGSSGEGISNKKTQTQIAQPGKCAGGLCGQ